MSNNICIHSSVFIVLFDNESVSIKKKTNFRWFVFITYIVARMAANERMIKKCFLRSSNTKNNGIRK